jgi:hypothetical protein
MTSNIECLLVLATISVASVIVSAALLHKYNSPVANRTDALSSPRLSSVRPLPVPVPALHIAADIRATVFVCLFLCLFGCLDNTSLTSLSLADTCPNLRSGRGCRWRPFYNCAIYNAVRTESVQQRFRPIIGYNRASPQRLKARRHASGG